MTDIPAPHSHRWASQPVTGPTFDWKCQDGACGETVAYEWNPEWAQAGLERYEEDLVAAHGGTVARPALGELRAGLDAIPPDALASLDGALGDFGGIGGLLDSLEGAPGAGGGA